MFYLSGDKVLIGDNVLIERGVTLGVVIQIIESEKDMLAWQVTEPGLLIKSAPFGKVFWPLNDEVNPVIYVSRDST